MSESVPPTVADMLGNAGPLPEVVWRGKAYRVGLPCPEVIAHAERAVPGLALENVRAAFDGAELAREEEAVKAAVRGRKHGFGQALFNDVLGGADGDTLILYACVKLHHPEVTVADVRAMRREADGLELAVSQVAPSFFQAGAETMAAPAETRKAVGDLLAVRVAADLLSRARPAPTPCPTT